jgi:hypothetical protein
MPIAACLKGSSATFNVAVISAFDIWPCLSAASANLSHLSYMSLSLTGNPLDISNLTNPVSRYFIDYPLGGSKYGDQCGQRIEIPTKWNSVLSPNSSASSRISTLTINDAVILNVFILSEFPEPARKRPPLQPSRNLSFRDPVASSSRDDLPSSKRNIVIYMEF